MAKDNKENKETSPRITSKKHLARLERENRQKKILTFSIIGILVVVVGLIVYGILDKSVFQPMKPVAKVGNTKISIEKFQKRVEYERLSNVETFVSYASSPYASFFQSSLVQMQDQLDNYVQYGSDILDRMINEAVAAEKAKELGITVSEEDIDKELERGFGYFPKGTPTTEPTVEIRSTSTMSLTQLAIVTITPTPTEFPTETPLPTETLTPVTPTVEITSDGTTTVVPATPTEIPSTSTPTLEPTAEPTATATEIPPTATPYTIEGFEGAKKTMVANINSQFPYTDADFREYVRGLLINQKVYDYVNKDASRDQDMVWARHILVATEDEAKAVLKRLAAGEDFGALAAQLSTDTSNNTTGGDLGWFTKGTMVTEFETAAFALKIGEISEPVKTEFGYHIIQVLGHEVRQLTDEEFGTFKTTAFNKFIADAKETIKWEKNNVWASVVPSIPAIPAEYRVDTTQQ